MQTDDLRHIVQTFDPDRLRIAREASELLQRELAQQIEVSAAAVSQYEHGHARPSPHTLQQIAEHLGYPVEFFAGDRPLDEAEAAAGFFRKLARAPARSRQQAKVLPLLLRDLINTIERHVRLPPVSIPRFDTDAATTRNEVEEIARRLRDEWRIPSGPAPHIVRLLESHGVVVIRPQAGSSALDAFSRWFPDRPVIVLYSDKGDASRSRFDAAHELGHLVMHRAVPQDADWVEKQANWFGAAFLMPAADILAELPMTISWSDYVRLKLRWKVSIAALVRRAHVLKRLSADDYQKAMKALSARGWRKQEPSPLGEPEAPILLERAISLLQDDGIDIANLARQSRLPLHLVKRWLAEASDPRPLVQLD
jgi:Zn-dependent peptidase ImmA (M78 family)/transcriptional regulator with XRE-family HTH domain